MIHHALVASIEPCYDESLTYKEAMTCKESKKWIEAMNDEYKSLMHNKTWILVPRPNRVKIVSCTWLYRLKDGIGSKYKARLIA